MPITLYVLAAIAGWVVDDFCGTPPRPWPPGPWPWLRKLLAAIGGIGGMIVFGELMPTDTVDAVGIIIVSGISGAFLASLVSMAAGGMKTTATNDMR